MIPILYESGTTTYTTNGLGRLADCISCVVTEERNGIYECEFEYPITGKLFKEIEVGRIIACTHDEKGDIQPFIIYRRSIPDLRGVVTFNAHHISYILSDIVVMPFTASSCASALQGIVTNSANANPFSFWTDKGTTATFNNKVPRLARNMLGGEENSILDVFGSGEYEFDKFTVKLYANRGIDSGVEIRYAKNLADFRHDIDDSGTFNAIVPYWTDTDGHIVTLNEKIISYAQTGERVDAAPMDLSDQFDNTPTQAQLRSAARSKYERGDYALPSENIKVDFVQLWQTEEYKQFSALQRVGLCDTVTVVYPDANVAKIKQKVIRTVYNTLLDRYDAIELGTLSPSLGQAIREEILQEVPTNSVMEAAIAYATDMIRGGLGGYVVMTAGENGYPQEILIMDTPDINTAVNVWRFNQGGLGHSSTGYEGPYSDIALTQDGRINASLITTGTLNANIIKAGIITDYGNKNYWNLETGEFNTQEGKIGPFTITDEGLKYENGIARTYINEDTLSYGIELRSGFSRLVSITDSGVNFRQKDTSISFDEEVEISIIGAGSSLYLGFWVMDELVLDMGSDVIFFTDVRVQAGLSVSGTKSRKVKTDNYSDRLHYCYETPTPLFGDIGEAVLDEDGICYVEIDDIFTETIAEKTEYQVFLQKEGEGDCYIAEKAPRYFVIKGTPNLKVAWELKAKQRDYENIRLEQADIELDEYEYSKDDTHSLLDSYIIEQEELLYGYY